MANTESTPDDAAEASAISTKVCTGCGMEKPFDGFYCRPNKKGEPRPAGNCKVCLAAVDAEKRNAKRVDPVTGERIPVPERLPPSKDPVVRRERALARQRKHAERHQEELLEKNRLYRENNREDIRARQLVHIATNKESIAESKRRWAERNPEAVKRNQIKNSLTAATKAARKAYAEANKEAIKEKERIRRLSEKFRDKQRARYRTDLHFRLRSSMSSAICSAITRHSQGKKARKAAKTTTLLGCTVAELAAHLEGQFTEGMTWENQGVFGWHIDHIIPCASFDLSDPEQQKKCFHFRNLQPMWQLYNISKSDNLEWEPPEHIIEATKVLIQKSAIAQAA